MQVIELWRRNCGINLRVGCHELQWASSRTESRKTYVNFFLILLGIMPMILIYWAEAYTL